jgi:hypothetical protein
MKPRLAMFYELYSPSTVLWLVVASIVLFVAAPHLAVISRKAAFTLRLGAVALVIDSLGPFALQAAGHPEWALLLQPVCFALFWISFAVAAWQLVQGAQQQKGLL